MVETRASRRAAEEDSCNSSQPTRSRPRTKAGSNEAAPAQTAKPRTRSHARDEDSMPSAQTPSNKSGRARSNTRPQTPAQTPRTRSRARMEAEESVASSEVRVVTPRPHPHEEDSNNLRSGTSVEKVVSATHNRTSEFVSQSTSAQAHAARKDRSRPKARAQTPARTPRTRSRARKEAEESIASPEVRVIASCPHPDEQDSNNLQGRATARKDASAIQNRASGIASEASTPSRRIRLVARRTRAFGATNAIVDDEVGQLPKLTLGVAAKRTQSEDIEQHVTSDLEPRALDTPDPRRMRSSLRAQRQENSAIKGGDALPHQQTTSPEESIGLDEAGKSPEQRIRTTNLLQRKPQSCAPNLCITLDKESHKKEPSIAEFKSNKPLTRDPEANELLGSQFKSTETIRPLSRKSDQAELETLDDVETPHHVTPGAISLLPTDFGDSVPDQVHAIPVADDDPPPPPPVLQGPGDSLAVSLKNPERSTQELQLCENRTNTIDSKRFPAHGEPNTLTLIDTADRTAPKVIIDLEAEKSEEDDSPVVCEAALRKEVSETPKRAREPISESRNDHEKIADREKPLCQASTRLREEDETRLLPADEAKDVSAQTRQTASTDRAHEIPERVKQKSERSKDGTINEGETADHDDGNSKEPKDIMDGATIKVMTEYDQENESTVKQPVLSKEILRHESETDPHNVVNENDYTKVSSVEDILNMDEKSMSVFFRRNLQTSRMCRELLSQCYAQQTKLEFGSDARYQFIPKRRKVLPPMGPLAQIEVGDHFDNDQVWEELELRNKPLLAYLHRKVNAGEKQNKDAERALRRVTMNDDDSGSEQVELEGAKGGKELGGDIHNHDVEVPKYELSKGEGSEGEKDEPKPAMMKETREDKGQRKSVRFVEALPYSQSTERQKDIDVVDGIGDKHMKVKKKRPRIEDGFFNIADMDRFADEAEELALSGKLMASDDEQGTESMSEENESDVEEFNMEDMEDNPGRYLYSDFFDPPSKVSGSGKGVVKALQIIDEDEPRDSEALEEDPNSGDGITDITALESDETLADSAELTPLQRMRARSKKRIQVLEEASVAKKSWELRGEVSAFARPKDSLLDTEMQHDIAVKPKTFLSSSINESIEEVIKLRIVDGLFDDVVMRLPEEYVSNKSKKRRQELPEISQEKPTEGLAELYEKEFTAEREKKNREILSSATVQKELDEPLGEQQKEVNRLFEKLSKKLDALSSLHYTPIPDDTKVDVTVKTNAKAIASEEAIPEGVSSATLLAPKEVYSVNKKDLVGEKELSRDERRAARRRRKSKKRKTQAADESKKEAIAQVDPVAAEKRRAEAALIRRGKKPKLAENDPKLVAQSSTKSLIKRFGVVTNPEMETSQRKKPASHFRL